MKEKNQSQLAAKLLLQDEIIVGKEIPDEELSKVGDHKEEDLLAAFEKTYNKLKEAMLTTRQQIEARGREEGRQKEKLGIARTMFHAGEPIEKVARWTGLSQASIRNL